MRTMTCASMNGTGRYARAQVAFTSPATLPTTASWLHVAVIDGKHATARRLGEISP